MPEPIELKTLVYDNTSGAREIAVRTLQLLQRHATQSSATTPGAMLDELADTGIKVSRSKPEMAPVFSALNRFLVDAEAIEGAPEVGEFRIRSIALLQDHVRRLESTLNQTATHAASLIQNGDVVLTFSRSSTVLEALRRAKRDGKHFDVVTTESRPNLEGRALAKELAEEQIPIRLVVDAMISSAAEGADRILIGADAITNQHVLNKVGTRMLASAAAEHGIPLHVAAELGKAWVKRADPTVSLLGGRMRDPKEVWDSSPYGVEVVNLYLDLTRIDRVQSIATEDGVLSPADFWAHVQGRGYARRIRDAFHGELV